MDFNKELLQAIKQSFMFVIDKNNNNRSSAKPHPINTKIAENLKLLCKEEFLIEAKEDNKQILNIEGKYSFKNVNILIKNRTQENVAVIKINFLLSSFLSNVNNYFENLLSSTINIRSTGVYHFYIIILLKETPHFLGSDINSLINFASTKPNLLEKYEILSNDDIDSCLHSPSLSLMLVLKDNSKIDRDEINSKSKYYDYYKNNKFDFDFDEKFKMDNLGKNFILNNYEAFLKQTIQLIKTKK